MADNMLGGLLGGEEQPDDIEKAADIARAEATLGADAFAAAVALHQAGYGPEVAAETVSFLRAQRELLLHQGALLRAQLHHLNDEQALRTSMMRGQRTGLRIRVMLQAFTALALSIAAGALLWMVVQAANSRSVVVDDFATPPALAATGVNGRTVATGILDTLRRLQAATRATSAGRTTVGAWASDIKVAVPETGLSIGEIDRLLHAQLGNDEPIDGELVLLSHDQVALTVRSRNVPARTFRGAASGLDQLTLQAAEYVYGRSQPARYAVYLVQTGRFEEALAFVPDAFARAENDRERALLANDWGAAFAGENRQAPALEKYQLAMALVPRHSPEWWTAWTNVINARIGEGEERMWQEGQAYLNEAAAAPVGQRPKLRLGTNAYEAVWDLPGFLAAIEDDAKQNGGAGATSVIDGPVLADIHALMHDPAAAARAIAASDPADPMTGLETKLLAGYAALDRGDPAAAVAPLRAYYVAWQGDPNLQSAYPDTPCYLGLALGLSGQPAEAEKLFARIGPWSRCTAFHGQALAAAGDAAGAAKVWAAGLLAAPDLPFVYLARGQAALAAGNLASAEADFSTAHAKAPHFADPLKAWGDALARHGDAQGAAAKYAQARRYAPAWAALAP